MCVRERGEIRAFCDIEAIVIRCCHAKHSGGHAKHLSGGEGGRVKTEVYLLVSDAVVRAGGADRGTQS